MIDALAALVAGGVLRGDDPEVGGQLVGVIEAVKVADLGAQAERGERVDPAQAPQPGDRHVHGESAASCSSSASIRSRRANSTSWACR